MLALSLCLQCIIYPARVRAADSASSTTSVVQNDVYIDAEKTLSDSGNGIFRLTLEASSYIKSEYRTQVHEYSEDGYYVIQEDGYYLVEVWGGSGAAGGDSVTTDNLGGLGGSAGYVYGYMYLTKGQTVLFTIGTDGQTATVQESGGGANEGGNHETWSVYDVGGGGGYSAVYLFNSTKTSFSLSEQERLNNYIMIAGGGGGGGAASSLWETATGRPNGGRGGHVTASLSGHLSANDNNGVAGTYFAGSDGRSSGTNASYVGKGGTNVPGAVPKSWDGWSAVLNPNDWTGTYEDGIINEEFDRSQEPGCGGMGARRGGAGGAGFCGGSGGFQTSPWLSTNIGGGGGGSSFIADTTINGDAIVWQSLPASVRQYLNDTNYSHVGGSCVITYLGAGTPDESTVDTAHMQDVDITGTISRYFDIVSATSTTGTVTVNGQTVTVIGADISPDAAGYREHVNTLQLIIKAKDGFAGGNNVPVIDNVFTLTPVDHSAITVEADPATDYANVPLMGFKATARSYMSNDPDESYPVNSLYTDEYANARNNMSDWKYMFLSSIGSYSVKRGTSTISGSVSPDVTTEYTVQFTVTPKTTDIAVVGTPVAATTYSAVSTITIVEADMGGTLNGLDVDATKFLSYNGTGYNFALEINQKSGETFVPTATHTSTTTGDGSWVVPVSGWYYIQSWGANGGDSGDAIIYRYNGNVRHRAYGGDGGAGGYVSGYVFFQEDDVIYYTIGGVGSSSSNESDQFTSSTGEDAASRTSGGGGGGFSRVTLNATTLIISGGGGGAGGAAAAGTTGSAKDIEDGPDGTDGYDNSEVGTTLGADSSYNGSAGTRGRSSATYSFWGSDVSATPGDPGACGSNYRLSAAATGYDTTETGKTLTESARLYGQGLSSSKGSNVNGRVTITLLETEESAEKLDDIYDLNAEGTMSRYFDISSISLSTDVSWSSSSTATNADNSRTVTYKNSSGGKVAQFTYKLTENADGTTSWQIYDTYYVPTVQMENVTGGYNVRYLASLYFTFTMKPKEGFLGGNDVPLVQYGTTGSDDTGVKVSQRDEGRWLNKKDISDYANVSISYPFSSDNLLTQNKTIISGQSVDQAELITVNTIPLPGGNDAWKSEFVKAVYPTTQTVAPTKTTTYTFTQQVVPKAAAEKAVVVPSADPAEYSQSAAVYVNYTVTSQLTNITYNGPETASAGEALSAKLTPYGGYLLPDSITVTAGGSTVSDFAYDADTGMLTIPGSAVTGNIVISGSARILTYGIYYTYEDPATGETVIVQETGHDGTWAAGETVDADDLEQYNALNSGVTHRDGYAFHWEWGTSDGSPVTVMPASDLYVVGVYEPIAYTLTVHYVYQDPEGTVALADDYVGRYYYQDSYSIASPNVAGYLAQQTAVSGTVGTEDVELTVYYDKTVGQLNIVYLFADSQTIAAETYTQSIAVDETYAVPSPDAGTVDALLGYTADIPVVEGTVTAEQAESGLTIYVLYQPDRYQITFDPAGGTLAAGDGEKTVVYNNIYGYDPTAEAAEQYSALPTPLFTGFNFLGWYDENDQLVTEETVVSYMAEGKQTLTAKWEGQSFALTVHYAYSNGEKAADSYVGRYTYGQEYNVPSPAIEGYTPAPDVTGTMGAGNKVIFVTYTIDIHSITVNYIAPDGTALATRYYTEQDYGTPYSVTSPTVAGYVLDEQKNGGDLSVVSGTVGTSDIVVNVYYAYIEYTLTVNYVSSGSDADYDESQDLPQQKVITGLHIGDTYSEIPPEVYGYSVTPATQSGTVGTSNVTLNFTYTRSSHTLTVVYRYDQSVLDETLRGTDYETDIITVKYNSAYTVDVAGHIPEGYKAFETELTGIMPNEDMELIVYLFEMDAHVAVDIAWGDLNFVFTASGWDPESHGYTGSFAPEAEGQNTVTVTNTADSTFDIVARYSYSGSDGYDSMDVTFSDADGNEKNQSAVLAPGAADVTWIWVEGIMPSVADVEQTHTIGTCTVTIERGNS